MPLSLEASVFRPTDAVKAAVVVEAPYVIVNVVPGDFDYDGRLDVLVSLKEETSPSAAPSFNDLRVGKISHRIYYGTLSGFGATCSMLDPFDQNRSCVFGATVIFGSALGG